MTITYLDHRISAVIFDMDGLLLDTEIIAWETFQEACDLAGFTAAKNIYLRCIGTSSDETARILQEGYGPNFRYEEIYPIWSRLYRSSVVRGAVPLKTGARDFLNFLSQMSVKVSVATSTRHELALSKLRHAGLLHHFEFVVGGDQVDKAKPDPEIYFKTMALMNEEPRHCLVLEDSDNGVRAAHLVGAHVVQVPDMKEPDDEIRELGHMIVRSLDDARGLLMT